jgi:proteasome accessory factor B
MSSSSPPIYPEDRLFHLILALMSTSHGLNKEQILTTVRGYREDTERGMARASIERRFEHDKVALRELGIPLEATIPPEDDGNNKNTLYRIPKVDYDIPSDISFTARDVAILNIAAAVWREGSLSKEAHIAQMKLASYGLSVDENLLGFAPIISTRDPALRALRDAIDQEFSVSFDYAKPGEKEPTSRTISPWALVNHEGRWHLYGLEHSTGVAKTFLLRRIVSTITPSAQPMTSGPPQAAAIALSDLQNLFSNTSARLIVKASSDALAVLQKRPGTHRDGEHLIVHYTDEAIFASELTAFGADARVVEPASLLNRVLSNLKVLVDNHG